MYKKEGNIVLSADIYHSSDVVVTTVDDDGDTIVTICDDATFPIVDIADFPISLDFVDCPNDEVSSNTDVSSDSAS